MKNNVLLSYVVVGVLLLSLSTIWGQDTKGTQAIKSCSSLSSQQGQCISEAHAEEKTLSSGIF